MSNPESTPRLHPRFPRLLAIATLALAALALGHWGYRALRPPPSAAGAISAGAVPKDRGIPAPPQSECVGALASKSQSGRLMLRYRTTLGETETTAFYAQEMPRLGWREVRPASDAPAPDPGVRAYSNAAGDWCTILVAPGPSGGAMITVVRHARHERTSAEY